MSTGPRATRCSRTSLDPAPRSGRDGRRKRRCAAHGVARPVGRAARADGASTRAWSIALGDGLRRARGPSDGARDRRGARRPGRRLERRRGAAGRAGSSWPTWASIGSRTSRRPSGSGCCVTTSAVPATSRRCGPSRCGRRTCPPTPRPADRPRGRARGTVGLLTGSERSSPILGLGGTGKTRLALAAPRRAAVGIRGRRLARPARRRARARRAACRRSRRARRRDDEGGRSPRRSRARLRARPTLLVLDNFEQLVDGRADRRGAARSRRPRRPRAGDQPAPAAARARAAAAARCRSAASRLP